jgi:hypothetical protein
MDAVFSLPYSEYEAIVQIQRHFKKSNGFSVFVPTNRQQKGIDFIILNTANLKILRFQVKGSRPYHGEKDIYKHTFWFNNFFDKYASGSADVYILFGLYPLYNVSKNIKSRKQFWKSLGLAFTDSEMREFLDHIRTKKGERDKFFYISFNDPSEGIFVTRGHPNPQEDIKDHLLANKRPELQELLQKLR